MKSPPTLQREMESSTVLCVCARFWFYMYGKKKYHSVSMCACNVLPVHVGVRQRECLWRCTTHAPMNGNVPCASVRASVCVCVCARLFGVRCLRWIIQQWGYCNNGRVSRKNCRGLCLPRAASAFACECVEAKRDRGTSRMKGGGDTGGNKEDGEKGGERWRHVQRCHK